MTITFAELFNFATIIFVLGIFPGLGVTTIVSIVLNESSSVKKRWKIGIIAGLGTLSADLIYVFLVTSGTAFFAIFFENFGFYIKILGILILLWFAIENFFFAVSSTRKIKPRSALKTYFFCLSVAIGNPKVFVFYLGFLPGFFDLGGHSFQDILAILSAVFVALSTAFVIVVALADILAKYLNKGNRMAVFNKVVGIILFLLVFRMIFEVFPQFFS